MKSLIDSRTIRSHATVSVWRNLFHLLIDWLTVGLVLAGCIAYYFYLQRSGHSLWWLVPVWGIGSLLIGCIQHRIALMGHEASHYLLVPHRKMNDLLAELFCFFPIFAGLVQYRAKHLSHHQHPNHPEKDANLGNGKAERIYGRFPMSQKRFSLEYYLKFFWPPFVIANILDLLSSASLGTAAGSEKRRYPATLLGVCYFVILIVVARCALYWQLDVAASLLVTWIAGSLIWSRLSAASFFSEAGLAFSIKTAGLLRMSFYTLLVLALGEIAQSTGWDPTPAFLCLWVLPLIYVFPYLMILREVFQHANAGQDQLDNSRIIRADGFTRWAVLGYGNDFHLIHHLYPNIPSYRLRSLHDELLDGSEEYRDSAEQNVGIHRGESSVLKSLGRS